MNSRDADISHYLYTFQFDTTTTKMRKSERGNVKKN
jgi:hypothetical protein